MNKFPIGFWNYTTGQLTAKDVTVKLIPYYAWNHRGAGKMDVWLARSLSGLED